MVSSEAASALSRGGNLRLAPSASNVIGMVAASAALSLVGLRAMSVSRAWGLVLLAVLLCAVVVALILHSRVFVRVTGPTLQWRDFGRRAREVSLATVDMPRRSPGLGGGSLEIWADGARVLTMSARQWGKPALETLEARLLYNARVGRPAAVAADRAA